jgi:hypothetical protein
VLLFFFANFPTMEKRIQYKCGFCNKTGHKLSDCESKKAGHRKHPKVNLRRRQWNQARTAKLWSFDDVFNTGVPTPDANSGLLQSFGCGFNSISREPLADVDSAVPMPLLMRPVMMVCHRVEVKQLDMCDWQ